MVTEKGSKQALKKGGSERHIVKIIEVADMPFGVAVAMANLHIGDAYKEQSPRLEQRHQCEDLRQGIFQVLQDM